MLVQQLVQYCNVSHSPLALCFVELQKAYDSVVRTKLWSAMVDELNVPSDLVLIIKNMYLESRGVLQQQTSSGICIDFSTFKGVKQGDGASPELFVLYFDRVFTYIKAKMAQQSYTRQQSREYTVACLSLFMLAFADDIVLIAPQVLQLQKLISVFAAFCRLNDLVINTKKTEVMLIHCKGKLYVDQVQLQQCDTFKYLGIEIKANSKSPGHILSVRVKQAKIAFLRIKNNARLLGLQNSRVRLQLVQALVVSVLLFGAPLFACLSDMHMTMTASSSTFREAEDLARDLLRWALHAHCDTRNSVLYVLGNSESVQLLCHKQCWRFFRSLEQHPRAATEFIRQIQQNGTIPPEHWGASTIRWWPDVAAQYPQVANTQPLYRAFRKAVIADLVRSERLRGTGLTQLLCDIASYSFAGAPKATPEHLYDTLIDLIHPHHALLVESQRGERPTILTHQWPSWLEQGSSRVVRAFFELFYPPREERDTYGAHTVTPPVGGHCSTCGQTVTGGWWHHVLYECPSLSCISESAQWRAFVTLLQSGHRGLAMYSCFPLFVQHMPRLAEGFTPLHAD